MKTVKRINREAFRTWLTSLHPNTKVSVTTGEDAVDRFVRLELEGRLPKDAEPKWVKDFRKVLGRGREHAIVTARRAATVLESL